MKGLLTLSFVLLIALAVGCAESAPSTQVETTTLLEKYREAESTPKVTVLFFITQGCPPNVRGMRDFLEGLETLSDGEVRFIEVDAEKDKEGKLAYGVVSFPTVLFFDGSRKLRERRGPELDMETGRKIVTDLGATIKESPAK
jgi:thiol-disulfide isomerase/thioredoxin